MQNTTLNASAIEAFMRKNLPRGPFKPILYYEHRLHLITICTEDVSYHASRVPPTLEVFFRNDINTKYQNEAVGLSIRQLLICSPEEMLASYYRYSWGVFYAPFRWWHNITRRLVPAQKILDVLGVHVEHNAWGRHETQALDVLETPVFVRLA